MSTERRAQLRRRLARLGGQVQGLAKMVNSEDWKKMLVLSAAVEGAVDQVTADLFEGYLESLGGEKSIAQDARKALEIVLRRI